jgi:hypothetical protein
MDKATAFRLACAYAEGEGGCIAGRPVARPSGNDGNPSADLFREEGSRPKSRG